MTSSSPQTVHLLSKRSVALNRDTFIFSTGWGHARLIFGLNQKLTQASSASLHRWIRLLGRQTKDCELSPVELDKWPETFLAWFVKPLGTNRTVISPRDSTTLPAGNYVWYGTTKASKQYIPVSTIPEVLSLLEEDKRGHQYYDEEVINKNALTASIKHSVMERDKQCFFTAGLPQKDALDVSWILPPMWTFKPLGHFLPDDYDSTPYITDTNAIAMQKGLIPFFLDNAFGVDIDDKYRIVIFKDIGDFQLPTHLPYHSESASTGPSDRFLRKHFQWCLEVNLCGGDIKEDYSGNDMCELEGKFGVDEDMDLLPADDDEWKTPIGKEILDMCYRMEDPRLTPAYDLLR